MSTLREMAVDLSGLQAAADKACQTIDALRGDRDDLRVRVDELETALNRMVLAHENLVSDTEGRYPSPDCGCIECTVGTVPDRLNTGLCAYHESKRLLGQL